LNRQAGGREKGPVSDRPFSPGSMKRLLCRVSVEAEFEEGAVGSLSSCLAEASCTLVGTDSVRGFRERHVRAQIVPNLLQMVMQIGRMTLSNFGS
jgi:hypothetical protein